MHTRERKYIGLIFLGILGVFFSYALGEETRNVQVLIDTLLKGEDTAARIEAAKQLAHIQEPVSLETLLAALEEPNRHVRWAAIESLGELGDPKAVPALLQYFERPEAYRWGKRLVINALRAIKAPEAVSSLTTLMEDGDPYVRRLTLMALGKLEVKQAIPRIIEALKDEADIVRREAQRVLVQLTEGQIPGRIPRDYDSWKKWYSTRTAMTR